MSVVSAVRSFLATRRIADRAALRTFMESQAADLVQYTIAEYTKTRTNKLFSTLMRPPLFLDSYEKVRWQSFPAAISMVAEMVEGTLRQRQATAPGQLDEALVEIVGAIVSRYPQVSRQSHAFWQRAVDRVASDLAEAALGQPRPVHAIPRSRAGEIFDLLPVPSQLRQHDLPVFLTIISAHLTEIKSEFEAIVVPASLASRLSG